MGWDGMETERIDWPAMCPRCDCGAECEHRQAPGAVCREFPVFRRLTEKEEAEMTEHFMRMFWLLQPRD